MLIDLAQHVVADARAREAEGDFPSPRRYSAEQVESALVTVADALLAAEAERDALREALSRCEQYGNEAVKLIAREAIKQDNAARALTEKNNG